MSDTLCMRRKLLLPCVALSAMTCMGGCSSNSRNAEPIQRVNGAAANELNANHSRFEETEDPPISADTRVAAGQLAESQGLLAQAAQQYGEALKVDPSHQVALYRLGTLRVQLKQFPQAIDAWKQYVRATNGSAAAYSNLGFCHELAGQPGAAEDAYRQGIAREPTNQPCRVNYGLMLARNGREAEAVTQLSAVLSPAEVHYNLASVYEQLGRQDQARAGYQRALELDPKLWEAQSRLSKLD